jgi:hypothetical protein
VCEADGHGECRSAVCQPEISGAGSLCRAEFKKLPRALVRVNLTFSYGEFSPVPGNKPRRVRQGFVLECCHCCVLKHKQRG